MTSSLLSVATALHTASTANPDVPTFTFDGSFSISPWAFLIWTVIIGVATAVFVFGMTALSDRSSRKAGYEWTETPKQRRTTLIGVSTIIVLSAVTGGGFASWFEARNAVSDKRDAAFAEWFDENYSGIDIDGAPFSYFVYGGGQRIVTAEVDGKEVRLRATPQLGPIDILTKLSGSWQIVQSGDEPLVARK